MLIFSFKTQNAIPSISAIIVVYMSNYTKIVFNYKFIFVLLQRK